MGIAVNAVASSGLATPLQTRALALVAAAISDATVATWDSKYTYNRPHPSDLDPTVAPVVAVPQSPSYPSEHAAAAGAAAAVLSYLFPAQASSFADMADQAATSRVQAGVAFPSDVFAGLDLGQSVGQAVIAYAQADGSNQVFTGSFPTTPGCGAVPIRSALWREAGRPGSWQRLNNSVSPAPPAFGSDAENAAVRHGQEPGHQQHHQPLGLVLATWFFPAVAATGGS